MSRSHGQKQNHHPPYWGVLNLRILVRNRPYVVALVVFERWWSRPLHSIQQSNSPPLSPKARSNNCHFRFEAACGDGVPIFNLARYCLPDCLVTRFEGINNTTTNLILQQMEEKGCTLEQGLKLAQDLGIAEADPTGDLDGFDAAVKCLVLARGLMPGTVPGKGKKIH